MFKTITNINDYIHKADVEKLNISYDNKMSVNLFGNEILLEKNKWLWHLHLKITCKCDAQCSFCVEQNQKCIENSKFYIQQVEKVLSEMEKANCLYSVSVTGGEPTLFPLFDELCDVLSKHHIGFLTMNTNGSYINKYINNIDGLFDWIDISRHAVDDTTNQNIFKCQVPTLSELKQICSKLKKTKVRIQCVLTDIKTIDELYEFINTFSFANDISIRKLMKLGKEYGVEYDENETFYNSILDHAYKNWELKEQTIQDYYVYEIWNYNGIDITLSYSNMKMLLKTEKKEAYNVCREFILHPDGTFSGSWTRTNKIILEGLLSNNN